MNELVRQVTESKSPLMYGVSEWDVNAIWDSLSSFVEKQMLLQKGVHISGLGTFSFVKKKMDIGPKKNLMQRPVFIFSEKLTSTLDLTYPKHYTPGSIPIVNLNYAAISVEQNSPRDVVENCVKELLAAFCRAVNNGKNVDLVFPKVGRLTVRGKKCKMKFYKPFIDKIDGSGSLVKSMQNRLDTPDSVISEKPVMKSNTVVIPCPFGQEENAGHLSPVVEEKVNVSDDQFIQCEAVETEQVPTVPPLTLQEDVGIDKDAGSDKENIEVEIGAVNEEQLSPVVDATTDVAIENIMKTTNGISAKKTNFDFYIPHVSKNEVESYRYANVSPPEAPRSQLRVSSVIEEPILGSQRFPVSIPKSVSAGPTSRRKRSFTLQSARDSLRETEISACCDHHDAGQEICYLCHQRAQRNVYIPFKKEKAKMSVEEDNLLQNYQFMKNTEEALKEKEKKEFLRQELKDMQKMNQEMAQMRNTQKKEKNDNFEQCYLFQRRPLTPPLYVRMSSYGKELEKQIELNAARRQHQQEQENFLGKTEQRKLAEDLARQRADYFKDKVMRTNLYKKALDTQVQNRELPSPEQRTDIYYFGKYNVTPEMMAEKKRVAIDIMNEQCQQVAQQKREAILKRMKEQQHDGDILEKNKSDLLRDRAMTFKQNYETRKNLEQDWRRNIDMKQEKRQESKEKERETGMLVQDQCKRYHRCQQCKRGLRNRGSCNIWTDTFYLPGSRYII